MTLREKFSWLRSDTRANIRHYLWRIKEYHKIWRSERLIEFPWQSEQKGVVATIDDGEFVYSLFDSRLIDSSEKIKFTHSEFHLEGDGGEGIGWAKSAATDLDVRVNELSLKIPHATEVPIIVSTLIFNDYAYLHDWLNHYRKLGVDMFLLYFNGKYIPESLVTLSENSHDVEVIAWPLRYARWARHIGRKSFHCAQPAQIMHSVLLLRRVLHSGYVLTVDVDEFIVSAPFSELIRDKPTELGFPNVWARGHSGFVTGDFLVNPNFDGLSLERRKVLRDINYDGAWNIHGSDDAATNVQGAGMLHFYNMSREYGHGRFVEVEAHSDFVHFETFDDQLRESWYQLYHSEKLSS
jgi:hypothetical protein